MSLVDLCFGVLVFESYFHDLLFLLVAVVAFVFFLVFGLVQRGFTLLLPLFGLLIRLHGRVELIFELFAAG